MRITESSLQSQASAYSYTSSQTIRKLEISIQTPLAAQNSGNNENRPNSTIVNLSEKTASVKIVSNNETEEMDPRLAVLIAFLEHLTGQKIKLPDSLSPQKQAAQANSAPTTQARSVTHSIHIETRRIREEAEGASYQAQGQVKTADGRSISFSMGVSMQYYSRSETSFSLDIGNQPKQDPLVLNLSTDQVRLEGNSISFDLNADGENDKLAKLASGSAYLVLDRNGNGQIDDGTELFGPTSGDGFEELGSLDSDGNGWIDEGDAAFSQLQVWRPGENTTSIADAGVGAIYLGREATPYTLRVNGEEGGSVRTTGMFLTESGEAKTIQQIDLVA